MIQAKVLVRVIVLAVILALLGFRHPGAEARGEGQSGAEHGGAAYSEPYVPQYWYYCESANAYYPYVT